MSAMAASKLAAANSVRHGGSDEIRPMRWSKNCHLDSNQITHHDAYMRTTVTIDDDVARLLRDAMHRRRTSFKEAINTALRRSLTNAAAKPAGKRFVVKGPFLGRMPPGIDPAGFNKLADQLEDEAVVAKMRRHRRR